MRPLLRRPVSYLHSYPTAVYRIRRNIQLIKPLRAIRLGSNTFQTALFPDGRIQFGYQGMTLGDGIVGISPGGNGPLIPADFTADTPFSTAALQAIWEVFPGGFDLAESFVLFTPNGQAGFDVQWVPPVSTTVIGRVVDELDNALEGLRASAISDSTGASLGSDQTQADGSFSISAGGDGLAGDSVRVVAAGVVVEQVLRGLSETVPVVVDGITDVGTFTAIPFDVLPPEFNPDIGPVWASPTTTLI